MNILLAVDDDRPSHRAAAAVTKWLPADAKVVALHVGRSLSSMAAQALTASGSMPYPYLLAGDLPDEERLEQAARDVAGWAAEITDGTPRVERGEPVATICQVASEIDADLIVVGTGDRSWLDRLLDPAVGTGVAANAPCSVLVVRSKREPEA